MKKFLLAIIVFSVIAGSFALYSLYRPYESDNPNEITFEIPKGSSTRNVAQILKSNDLIRSSNVFLAIIKKTGNENSLKAGRYTLSQALTYEEIIFELVEGTSYVESVRVTIPEGYELRQITELFVSMGIADVESFKAALDPSLYDYEFLDGVESDTLEGFLFPDTYDIPLSYDSESVVGILLDRFNEIYEENFKDSIQDTEMSWNEIVTLASIIERETKYPPERKTVSGVFHNRLDRHMRLESCATVQFAIGEWKDSLSYEDTSIESPYNTYRNKGLPPGPIASPGKASIEAAIHPENHSYKFFFAIPNDPEWRHVFSITYEDHLAAQARY